MVNDYEKNIYADSIEIGVNTYIAPSATIRGLNGNAKSVKIGDNTYIGESVQIIVDEVSIGDYCKIHHHVNFHGYKPLTIGHNAWIGQGTIIDSIGGVTIGNNCGIGAYSQLWSHIKYGDPLLGCNYKSEKPLIVGNDVWLVGHCIISPVTVGDRAMALVGSVITKDMEEDRIYGGSPARDLTDKVPSQFSDIPIKQKRNIISKLDIPAGVKIIESWKDVDTSSSISYFNIVDRTYTKKLTPSEITFMKTLQSELIKFVPYANT